MRIVTGPHNLVGVVKKPVDCTKAKPAEDKVEMVKE